MKKALFVGRFQPMHLGHLKVIKWILKKYDKVIIVIGSSQDSFTDKNPFTLEERKKMIQKTLRSEKILKKKYSIIGIPDVYDDDVWVATAVNGLFCHTHNNWEIVYFPGGYNTERINCIDTPPEYFDLLTDSNSIWFGTANNGIFVLFEKEGTENWLNIDVEGIFYLTDYGRNPFPSGFKLAGNYILCINFEGDNLWVGYGGSGASRWNYKTDEQKHYTLEDGLADMVVYSIAVDSEGRAWFGTDGGLSVIEE